MRNDLKRQLKKLGAMSPEEQAIFMSGAATVTFEDHGQDFLVWHIKDRHVVGCEPFQARIWCGREVISFPRVGERLCVRMPFGRDQSIKYPVAKVEALRMNEERAA